MNVKLQKTQAEDKQFFGFFGEALPHLYATRGFCHKGNGLLTAIALTFIIYDNMTGYLPSAQLFFVSAIIGGIVGYKCEKVLGSTLPISFRQLARGEFSNGHYKAAFWLVLPISLGALIVSGGLNFLTQHEAATRISGITNNQVIADSAAAKIAQVELLQLQKSEARHKRQQQTLQSFNASFDAQIEAIKATQKADIKLKNKEIRNLRRLFAQEPKSEWFPKQINKAKDAIAAIDQKAALDIKAVESQRLEKQNAISLQYVQEANSDTTSKTQIGLITTGATGRINYSLLKEKVYGNIFLILAILAVLGIVFSSAGIEVIEAGAKINWTVSVRDNLSAKEAIGDKIGEWKNRQLKQWFSTDRDSYDWSINYASTSNTHDPSSSVSEGNSHSSNDEPFEVKTDQNTKKHKSKQQITADLDTGSDLQNTDSQENVSEVIADITEDSGNNDNNTPNSPDKPNRQPLTIELSVENKLPNSPKGGKRATGQDADRPSRTKIESNILTYTSHINVGQRNPINCVARLAFWQDALERFDNGEEHPTWNQEYYFNLYKSTLSDEGVKELEGKINAYNSGKNRKYASGKVNSLKNLKKVGHQEAVQYAFG